jgi:hypothetical protein
MAEETYRSDSERISQESWSGSSSDESASLPISPEILSRKVDNSQLAGSKKCLAQPQSQATSSDGSGSPLALGAIRIHNASQSEQLDLDSCICVGGPHVGTAFPGFKVDVFVEQGWMQTDVIQNQHHSQHYSVRISVVSENAGRSLGGSSMMESRKLLKHIMSYMDKSKSAWEGDWNFDSPFESYLTCPEQESLFYLFNTLPSPSPSAERIVDIYARRAVEDILDNSVAGLQTTLYPYQQRSAAMMIQRETCPQRRPDPRKPCFHGPTGQAFYYDKEEGTLLLQPSLYEEPRGGILAETMGYGKTLICLAVILASRGHYSHVPEDRLKIAKKGREKVASLADMAVAKIVDDAVPWKAELYDLAVRGYHYDRCVELLRFSFKEYTEKLLTPQTPNRSGKRRAEKAVRLCSTNLIIVPPNLLVQWQHEIKKHT